MFLPPNTASKLQPLQAGIIQNVKIYYRKQILCHVLCHIDVASCASELAEKVHIVDAVMWLKSTWDAVTPETIKKCFSKCGIVDTIVDEMVEDGAESLIMLSEGDMTWQGHVNCDKDVAINQTLEKDWEKNLLASM